jgi:hypothetical protein
MASVVEIIDRPCRVGGLFDLRGVVALAVLVLCLELSGISNRPDLFCEVACRINSCSRSLVLHFLRTW